MKKTLILSALMAVAVTFMSCTSDTDDGISPAVLVSLQQQQEAEQELYKKNERVAGTWIYEYEATILDETRQIKHTLTINPNGTGNNTVTYTPHCVFLGHEYDSEGDSFKYSYDEDSGLSLSYRIDIDNDTYHIHKTYTDTIEIRELTDTTMKLYIPQLTTAEERESDLYIIGMCVFGSLNFPILPEITTWTKLQ